MDDLDIEEKFFTTNSIKLHTVFFAGPQSGVSVILFHGFPENWRSGIHQLAALVEVGCRVIVPDQRGYNLSEKPKGIKGYRIDTLVKDIMGLIEALVYQKVNLVGQDWGAVVAWTLTYQHPERGQRIGILTVPHPLVMPDLCSTDFEQMCRSWYVFFFQLPGLPEMGMSAEDWRGPCLARQWIDPNFHEGGYREIEGSLVTAWLDNSHDSRYHA